MASYFVKLKVTSRYSGYSDSYEKTTIIDFDKFEKVNSTAIYAKLRANVGHNDYRILDMIKL